LSIGALLTEPERFRDRSVCCIVSGGNIDMELMDVLLRRPYEYTWTKTGSPGWGIQSLSHIWKKHLSLDTPSLICVFYFFLRFSRR
jgi:hypothetical protein